MSAVVLTAALKYAGRGIPVFPCKNQPGNPEHKRPLTRNGFKDATTDLTVIQRWWNRWPNALIAVPTGAVSGICVLDLDVKNGKDGFIAVPDWRNRSSVIALTGSGGAHLYYRADGTIRCTTSAIGPGIDTRGGGGYAIVPPSFGYSWLKGNIDDRSDLPPWPDDLRPRENPRSVAPPPAHLPAYLIELMADAGTGLSTDPSDLLPKASPQQIVAALNKIDPDTDHRTWIAIGAALFSELGDEKGFDAWNGWSSRGRKYPGLHRINRHWSSIVRANGYGWTIATLFYHANKTQFELIETDHA